MQLDAGRFHQALDGDFTLQPLDLFVRYTRDEKRPPWKPVKKKRKIRFWK
jgi:hypothetical protein